MKVWALGFDDSVRRMTREEANADESVWIYFTYDPAEQLAAAKERTKRDRAQGTSPKDGMVAVYGAGDETKSVYGDDGKPYRFKEGSKKGQMSELKHRMEERFEKNNKAAWPVKVDVSY